MSRRAWIIVAILKGAPLAFWLLVAFSRPELLPAAGISRTACFAVAAASFFGTDVFLLYQLFVPSGQALCRVFTHFETDRPELWLTIDDGPDPEDTPRILDLLGHHGARATFFVIGERAARHPDLVDEILRRGHEVAHHTQTHPAGSFWCAGPVRLRRELDEALAALRDAGAEPRWFRPPVGIKNCFLNSELAKRHLECVGWSVRSHDSTARDPADVVQRILARLRPGSIILMHEGPRLNPRVRVRAIQLLLEALAGRKFACVLPERTQLR